MWEIKIGRMRVSSPSRICLALLSVIPVQVLQRAILTLRGYTIGGLFSSCMQYHVHNLTHNCPLSKGWQGSLAS